jgi:quercetin 2,3-dioxygenase
LHLLLINQGAVKHEDFEGHKGLIKAGDLQWMTAGRGVVHSEMPAGQGVSNGLQLWVNLSSKNKMQAPNSYFTNYHILIYK